MATARAEEALQAWLDELPAHAAAVESGPAARKVLLDDLVADEPLLAKAEAAHAHPVLLARGHLAHAAVQLLLASDAGDEAAASRALEHCERAQAVAVSLQSSGPRLALVGQVGALAAHALTVSRASQRRAAARLLGEVGEAFAAAFAEQDEQAQRGSVTLAAAQALAQGAKVVRGKARLAVLERSLELATDARRDLARAGELAKAALATSTIHDLEASLPKT